MSHALGRRAPKLALAAAMLMLAPASVSAQGIKFRFYGVDMGGGPVFPENSDVGAAFGARVGIASLFSESTHLGLGLAWWVADRVDGVVDVRDVVFSLDVWKELNRTSWIRPYFGLSGALHIVDGALEEEAELAGSPVAQADELDGYRVGAGALAGIGLRATSTGAIWFLFEYRYAVVSKVSNHSIIVGIRLVTANL